MERKPSSRAKPQITVVRKYVPDLERAAAALARLLASYRSSSNEDGQGGHAEATSSAAPKQEPLAAPGPSPGSSDRSRDSRRPSADGAEPSGRSPPASTASPRPVS